MRLTRSAALAAVLGSAVASCSQAVGGTNETGDSASGQGGLVAVGLPPLSGAPATFSLLIVTDASLSATVQRLVDFKKSIGTSTFMVTMAKIRAGVAGGDDAYKLKRTIADAYEQRGTKYVLLIGDQSMIPSRQVLVMPPTVDPNGLPPSDTQMTQANQVSDFYYANLYKGHSTETPMSSHGAFNDWFDPVTRGYDTAYGPGPDGTPVQKGGDTLSYNPGNVDGYADIAVGRIAAQNAADVAGYIQKAIAYESGLLTPASSQAYSWVSDRQYPDSNGAGLAEGVIAELRDVSGLDHSTLPPQSFVSINGFLGSAPPAPWQTSLNRDSDTMANLFKNSWWITYVGHGYARGLDGTWGVPDLASINNTSNLPIVLAVACLTVQVGPYLGAYHTQPYRDIAGLAHDFVLGPPAAASYTYVTDNAQGGLRRNLPFTPPTADIYQPQALNVRSIAAESLFMPGGAIAWVGDNAAWPTQAKVAFDAMLGLCSDRLGDAYLIGQRGYWVHSRADGDYFNNPRTYLNVLNLVGDPSLKLPACRHNEPAPDISAFTWANVAGGANVPLPPRATVLAESNATTLEYGCRGRYAANQELRLGVFSPATGCVPTNNSAPLTIDVQVFSYRPKAGLSTMAWVPWNDSLAPTQGYVAASNGASKAGFCRVSQAGGTYLGYLGLDSARSCMYLTNPGGAWSVASASSFEVLAVSGATRVNDDIVLRNSNTNQFGLWQMASDGSVANYLYPDYLYPDKDLDAARHTLLGTGDMDGDGRGDLVLQDATTGDVIVWNLSGTNAVRKHSVMVAGAPLSLKVQAIADFDGDGMADILWRDASNNARVWLTGVNNTLRTTTFPHDAIEPFWVIQGAGDFDGDGTADVLLRNMDNGDVGIWLMSKGLIRSYVYPQRGVEWWWVFKGTGDFNGDGIADVLWRKVGEGDVAIWQMNSSAAIGAYLYPQRRVEAAWTIQGTGDFNADGTTDILWRNTSTQAVSFWAMKGGSISQYLYPRSYVEPEWKIKGAVSGTGMRH